MAVNRIDGVSGESLDGITSEPTEKLYLVRTLEGETGPLTLKELFEQRDKLGLSGVIIKNTDSNIIVRGRKESNSTGNFILKSNDLRRKEEKKKSQHVGSQLLSTLEGLRKQSPAKFRAALKQLSESDRMAISLALRNIKFSGSVDAGKTPLSFSYTLEASGKRIETIYNESNIPSQDSFFSCLLKSLVSMFGYRSTTDQILHDLTFINRLHSKILFNPISKQHIPAFEAISKLNLNESSYFWDLLMLFQNVEQTSEAKREKEKEWSSNEIIKAKEELTSLQKSLKNESDTIKQSNLHEQIRLKEALITGLEMTTDQTLKDSVITKAIHYMSSFPYVNGGSKSGFKQDFFGRILRELGLNNTIENRKYINQNFESNPLLYATLPKVLSDLEMDLQEKAKGVLAHELNEEKGNIIPLIDTLNGTEIPVDSIKNPPPLSEEVKSAIRKVVSHDPRLLVAINQLYQLRNEERGSTFLLELAYTKINEKVLGLKTLTLSEKIKKMDRFNAVEDFEKVVDDNLLLMPLAMKHFKIDNDISMTETFRAAKANVYSRVSEIPAGILASNDVETEDGSKETKFTGESTNRELLSDSDSVTSAPAGITDPVKKFFISSLDAFDIVIEKLTALEQI